jgi:hypothetical protein
MQGKIWRKGNNIESARARATRLCGEAVDELADRKRAGRVAGWRIADCSDSAPASCCERCPLL